jgi:thiamine pyrophosphate-dependent acetolactate synthase large subunit-like protein
MIKQTQDQWFNDEYFASNSKVDLTFPDFSKVAVAMGFR